jgi:hypothetical protein
VLNLTTLEDQKIVKVEGSKSDIMLLYCFWQTYLWPDWMHHPKLGDISQHKEVIKTLNDEKRDFNFSLYNNGEQFKQALKFAKNKCMSLDMEVTGE